MNFLAPFRTGTRTLTIYPRASQNCAKRNVAEVTKGPWIKVLSHLSTVLRSTTREPKCQGACASKLQSAGYRELLMGVVFAAITLAITTGCGGSSGSAAVIVPATPSISPVAGAYAGVQQVTISESAQGAIIFYTTDGTVPTASSTVYASAISVTT